jgi:hypothetical protein
MERWTVPVCRASGASIGPHWHIFWCPVLKRALDKVQVAVRRYDQAVSELRASRYGLKRIDWRQANGIGIER